MLLGVLAAALLVVGGARAVTCPAIPLEQRLEGADVAFVGRLLSERPAQGQQRAYRFTIDQAVKGPVGREVEVHAVRLTDLGDRRLERDVAVGVLASTAHGGSLVSSSCSLVDPAFLLATADEPRGAWIKVVIGVLILGAVLVYSLRRLTRRRALESNP